MFRYFTNENILALLFSLLKVYINPDNMIVLRMSNKLENGQFSFSFKYVGAYLRNIELRYPSTTNQ